MVFPGRLSTGCYGCRQRKVKCDEAKPACRRCVKHGVRCPGYPDSFAWRTYNKSGRIETINFSKSNKTKSNKENAIQRNTRPVVEIPAPRSALSVSLEWQALCYFMHNYVLKVEKSPCRGHLVFLPELYQEKIASLSFKHAVLSVSYLSLFKSSRFQPLYVNARKHYGAALTKLAAALGVNELVRRDETLAASLLLSMFMDLDDERSNLLNPHIPGIYSLLQSWGKPQLSTKYGREVFGWALTQVQIQAVATTQFRYASLPASIETMDNPDTVCLAGIITSKISDFCRSVTETRENIKGDPSNNDCNTILESTAFDSLLKPASTIVHDIKHWKERIPPHWLRQFTFSSTTADCAIPPFQDPWTTCFLAVFYSSQIYFYLTVMDLCIESPLFSAGFHNSLVPDGCTASVAGRVQNLVGLICTAVQHTLGQINEDGRFTLYEKSTLATGRTLSWPIWIVLRCGFATPQHMDMCRQALDCIGSTMGYGLASCLNKAHEPLIFNDNVYNRVK